ncbi:hypothetical protein EDD11_004846 [Mortierella claussenii]|nr:hypothetical protein EDD11_004846 [Mortierella claussenii]
MIPSPTVTNVITTGTFSNNLRRVSQTPSEKSARDAAHRVVLGRQESSSVSRTDELLGLRERRSGGDTKQSTLGISDTRDTVRNQGEIEAALQNDRTQREEMEAGLSVLMQQLRHNAMAIHQTLADERSSGYLDDADQALDTNISRLGKERTRLELYSKQSRKTKWMIWGIVLAVSMVFVFMFFIIRIF